MRRLLVLTCLLLPVLASANTVKDLKYGTILFDYYQQNYFAALVGYEYAKATNELQENADDARLLQGGMTLSYGLPDHAQVIFNDLLNGNVDDAIANKAWYFLAKLIIKKDRWMPQPTILSAFKGMYLMRLPKNSTTWRRSLIFATCVWIQWKTVYPKWPRTAPMSLT